MASASAVTDDNQHSDQAMDTTEDNTVRGDKEAMSRPISPSGKPTIWVQEPIKDQIDEDKSVQSDSFSRAAEVNPGYTMTVVSSRRNANGTIGSVYSGNKIRHLKKDDGIPLWRKDIQYSFLRAVFEDQTRVFTLDVDGSTGHTFAEIYINAMARSSKTSKVLKEKLLTDSNSAINMAMICLLVNVGRMNTTLNFFPEMRAQLRTYHSIPCLQVNQDSNSQYKGLQDAPRLKSILKGSCEDTDQPNSIDKICSAKVPRTNPVNLIFVLAQYAPKISEQHFFQPRDFFDLVIRSTLSSKSRAKAFLWLIWWYLESDFSREAAENNPFGSGIPSEEDPDGLPIKVPAFEHLTEEQANAENVDTEDEKVYGEKMRLVRKKILEEDDTVGPPLKRNATQFLNDSHTASPARSEAGRTRSPSPSGTPSLNPPRPRKNAANQEGARSDIEKHQARPIKAIRGDRGGDISSPIPPGPGHTVINAATSHSRRARPETSHQRAVNLNRKMRIDKILHQKLGKVRREIMRRRRREMPSIYRVVKRISNLPDGYDSEEDQNFVGPAGMVPNPRLEEDGEQDYGGEAMQWKKVIDRAVRRLDRLEGNFEPKVQAMPEQVPLKSSSGAGSRGGRGHLSAGKGRGGRRKSVQPTAIPEETPQEAPQEVSRAETLDDIDLDLLREPEDMILSDPNETDDGDLTEDDFSYADPYATVI